MSPFFFALSLDTSVNLNDTDMWIRPRIKVNMRCSRTSTEDVGTLRVFQLPEVTVLHLLDTFSLELNEKGRVLLFLTVDEGEQPQSE